MFSPGFMAVACGQPPVGYQIANSLRFRESSAASLSRVATASTGNGRTFTLSMWVRRGGKLSNGAARYLACAGTTFGAGTYYDSFYFTSDDRLAFSGFQGGTYYGRAETTAVFRDPAAWYHVVLAIDTTQADGANRIKAWVNGQQVTFTTYVAPALNHAYAMFSNAGYTSYIGALPGNHGDHHIAQVVFVDGTALTPSSFGATDTITGQRVPKQHSVTYGAGGFWLEFKDASAATATAIGKDTSGNGMNFTPSGISVTAGTTFDQSTDTPTTSYPIVNPLNSQSLVAITEAGMAVDYGGTAYTGTVLATMAFPTSGKWYYECTCGAVGASDYWLGVLLNKSIAGLVSNIIAVGTSGGEYSYRFTGQKMINGTVSAYGASYTAGDVIGVAFDATNLTIEFFKNNTSQGQLTGMPSGEYIAFSTQYNGGITRWNFGQRPFSYVPPSGFKALNTANLPAPSIKRPRQ
jgi:hypothetical protein